MNRRHYIWVLLFAALFLTACANNNPTGDTVYLLTNEDELKEQLLQSKSKASYGIEYYYRPISQAGNLTLKHIELNQYNVMFTYTRNATDDDNVYRWVWRFSQPDGDAWLQDSIDRLGYVYVYPDNPIEGAKYISDLNRDEAKEAGRVSWDVDYSVNGVLFSASIPWDISDEDVTKFLQMEKVPLK